MAVVVVAEQNTRLDDAETTTQWGNIGGGPTLVLETDFVYQGTNCVARKGPTAQRGHFLSDPVDRDLTGTFRTVMFKVICPTPGLLDLLSVPGWELRIGSGSIPATPSVNHHNYHVHGSDTYPIRSSWLIIPINPNVVAHRTSTTGTPDLTLADFYALLYDQTGTSKAINQGVDAVDIGAGITLTRGDGADPDGLWQDFVDFDEGTVVNRFGYVTTFEGVLFVFGNLVIGESATSTVFNDSAKTLVFPDGLFAEGFSGLTADIQNVGSDIDWASCNFFGKGLKEIEDTRPFLTILGTVGAFDADSCVFDAFNILTLTSAATLLDCTLSNCESVIQAGGTLDGATVNGATTDGEFGAVKSFDDSLGTFDDETVDANDDGDADWAIFVGDIDDYVALGFKNKFSTVIFDNANGTAGAGITLNWEYWNGTAWAALTGVTDGTNEFQVAVSDSQVLTFTIPADWATQSLDGSAQLFYIRAILTGIPLTVPVYDQGFVIAQDVSFITSDNPANILRCNFTFSQGHAIEITATGTFTFDANKFTGYGVGGSDDAAIFNNSGGLVTLNIVNGGDTPTIKNGAGASTTINNNITGTITVKDEAAVVIQGAQVSVRKDSDNSEVFGGLTDVNGEVAASIPANEGAVNVRVRKGSGSGTDYIPVRSPQTIGATDFDVTITMIEDTLNAT